VKRPKTVVAIIAPLFADRGKIEVRRLGVGRNFVVGLLPRGIDPSSVTAPDQLRIATKVPGIFVNYHEIWLPDSVSAFYEMERAYLHVHQKASRDAPDRQILSLHCDLKLQPGDASFRYKRGPHLHVGGADPNIDRAHISVCLNDPERGGNDVASLTSTLSEAVSMINSEILPHYQS
jgi:hypothetical protein